MKIGILTYHNTRNCGALLQAYALQQALFALGIDNEIIDYRCDKIDEAYRVKHLRELKTVKMFIKWVLTIRNDKKTQEKFELFRKNILKLSTVYTKNTIKNANKEFDGFITGSDQVWNFYLNGDDYTYMLDFAEKGRRKISYAASMGSGALTGSVRGAFKEALPSFDLISVREKQLKDYIKETVGIEPELVLDPTLLISKKKYVFSGNERAFDNKYIFVYTVAPAPNIEIKAKELSKKTGYPIIWGHMSYKKKRGVKNVTDLAPNELVNYIKNAEYVLTSSFHGMAFSIIMQKQFFYDLDNNVKNNNARLETLSELLGLQDRELTGDDMDLCKSADIDYSAVNERLTHEREQSIDFLKKICI